MPSPADATAPAWATSVAGGVVLQVHVQPGASRPRVAGLHGGALKVRVRARPIEGAANRELTGLLATALAVRPADVSIVAGLHGRDKRVRIEGIDVPAAVARLGPLVDKAGGAD